MRGCPPISIACEVSALQRRAVLRFSVTFFSARGAPMAHSPQFLKLVQDAKKRVKETNVPDVKRRMDTGERFLLIDVREDNEWAKGHLPNAVHLGRGIIERDIEQRIPDTGAKLILYYAGAFRSSPVPHNPQQ